MNELFVMSLKAKHRSDGTIREYTKAIDNCLEYVNKPESEIKPIIITEKDIANAKFYRFVDELKYRSKYFSHCYENNP